jgi:hypothetical protein
VTGIGNQLALIGGAGNGAVRFAIGVGVGVEVIGNPVDDDVLGHEVTEQVV